MVFDIGHANKDDPEPTSGAGLTVGGSIVSLVAAASAWFVM